MNEPDRELFFSAQGGNMDAFEKIILFYEKGLFNYILRLTTNAHDAEDLTQETFLKIFNSIKGYDPDRPFKTWAYTIATRTVYDWFRRKKVRKELFVLDEEGADETFGDLSAYKDIETLKDLEFALKGLKPAYKSILLLHYREGFSYEEIAETFNIPLNTVKTNLRRAKLQLKKLLT
jgi:RNA polymerase sigma-70 factor (ECF subfamily)